MASSRRSSSKTCPRSYRESKRLSSSQDLEGVKDVSELHEQDPDGFEERLREARESARAWLDIAETEEQERTREAWASCRELAESKDILAEFVSDLERCGLVGERKNAKLLYLAMTSRLLEKIVSVAVKGPSSAGESYLVKLVSDFFPESAFFRLTAFSERTLLYTEQDLANKHLILSEAAGLGGDFQEYLIRTLLSEGFLGYEFVEKTSEGLRPRRIRKEGPTGFITTIDHARQATRRKRDALPLSDRYRHPRADAADLQGIGREENRGARP